MKHDTEKVLLIDRDQDLRALNDDVLTHFGFTVTPLPGGNDPVAYAEQTRPQAIVIGIRPDIPEDRHVAEDLLWNPVTRAIPVVAISVSEEELFAISALPNVSQIVRAPYDIKALGTAVSRALGEPSAEALPRGLPSFLRIGA